ncbi:hypothetical protein JOD27_003479 [Lentzea nigeriaca]|nr:hypothetical protein [Lentzea nigeriaca]
MSASAGRFADAEQGGPVTVARHGRRAARLADVIGRLAGDVTGEEPVVRERVPDWLARRLVHTTGVPVGIVGSPSEPIGD